MRIHRLYLVIALDCIHELGHAEDGVVVGDDQPLPVVGLVVLTEVLHDGLGLAAVTL